MAVAAELHAACPQPPALTPIGKPAGFVMSYTILSGRDESPLTPDGT